MPGAGILSVTVFNTFYKQNNFPWLTVIKTDGLINSNGLL